MRDKLYYWPYEDHRMSQEQRRGLWRIDSTDPVRLTRNDNQLRYVKYLMLYPDTRSMGRNKALKIMHMTLRF